MAFAICVSIAKTGDRLDQLPDLPLDAVAQIVRVHGVKLPTPGAVIAHEPSVARVLALVGGRERRQRTYMPAGESNSPELDVIAIILGETFR